MTEVYKLVHGLYDVTIDTIIHSWYNRYEFSSNSLKLFPKMCLSEKIITSHAVKACMSFKEMW